MECIVLILWIICGAAGAVICEARGRSALGGLFLGLLFGPIGLIICAVLPKDEQVLEQRALRSGQMSRCPHCAELVRREARVCRYCGRELTPSDFVKQGIVASKAGRKSEARQLLRHAIQRDSDNEEAWLWLSGAVETDGERENCLRRVLSINPDNTDARRGFGLLRERRSARTKSRTRWTLLALSGFAGAAVVVCVLAFVFLYLTGGLVEQPSVASPPIDAVTTTSMPALTSVPPSPARTHAVIGGILTPIPPTPTSIPPTPTKVPPTPTATFIPPGGTMRADPWDIQVETVTTAETLTSPTDGAVYKAEGRFALVFMALTNRGLSPQTFTSLDIVVVDSQGRRRGADIVVSTIAAFIYNTDFGSDVNPDATAHVVAAFDISKQGRSYRLMRRYREESGSIVLEIP